MTLPYSRPIPEGEQRAVHAAEVRDTATEVAANRPHAETRTNGEEEAYHDLFPASFTKGLAHNKFGLLSKAGDYRKFVQAINGPDPTYFDRCVISAKDREVAFKCKVPPAEKGCEEDPCDGELVLPEWRGWESPRAGHGYDLEGPDAGAVGMAPAPRVDSPELAFEMAEVYGLALLRDVPFSEIEKGKGDKLCADGGSAELSSGEIFEILKGMEFLSAEAEGDEFAETRRKARLDSDGQFTLETMFRGSTEGAKKGPYISQFLLAGNCLFGPVTSSDPDEKNCKGPEFSLPRVPASGFIAYGTQVIDQRVFVHKGCLDHMVCWQAWLDVQNGANTKTADEYEPKRRFITTPRDLATYVHFDQLYQAYLNAALMLLALGTPTSQGFPEESPSERRTAFATFGGPHILSLMTEVASRCLKAVRRQKFSYHRRARPEAIGGRLTLSDSGALASELKKGQGAFNTLLNGIPAALLDAVDVHNRAQCDLRRKVDCDDAACLPDGAGRNLLLPMAFPEGSPMHPAYGAGHATVAGGCVTMLKAFFEMFEKCDDEGKKKDDGGLAEECDDEAKKACDEDGFRERILKLRGKECPVGYFVPQCDGQSLEWCTDKELTIQGELDKLAANIAIGRNMAGVHYYSDYFDSLRMGERVAVGILLEQAMTYGEPVSMTFNSFDGDLISIYGDAGLAPVLTVSSGGAPVDPEDWWLHHV
jgi:hypothetical protein